MKGKTTKLLEDSTGGEVGGGNCLKEGEGISQGTYMPGPWTWTTGWGLTVGVGVGLAQGVKGEIIETTNGINNKTYKQIRQYRRLPWGRKGFLKRTAKTLTEK